MKKLYIIILLGLFACSPNNRNIIAQYPVDPELKRIARSGNLFGNKDGVVVFKAKKENNGSEKNNKKTNQQTVLWTKSLKVISQKFPISMVDEANGLILTDWSIIKSVSDNDSLYKANVIIIGNDFNKQNINLTVFKKLENQKIIEDEKVKDTLLNIIFTAK